MKHRIHLRREIPSGSAGRGLTGAARLVLEQARVQPSELTIVLTDSRRIRRLNARFAGEDAVTDVLAFPSVDEAPASRRRYLGDVVIAPPRARAQARRSRVPLAQELCLLAVHGTLHLIGHDHARRAERERMWRLQSSALRRLGLDPERLGVDR